MSPTVAPIDSTLKALLRYSKQSDCDSNWQLLRDRVLGSIYSPSMGFIDVFRIVLRAYRHALDEPRFDLPQHDRVFDELILAPIQGIHSIDFIAPPDGLATRYSIEQFYGAMLTHMIGNLRCTTVNWCRNEVWPEETAAAA